MLHAEGTDGEEPDGLPRSSQKKFLKKFLACPTRFLIQPSVPLAVSVRFWAYSSREEVHPRVDNVNGWDVVLELDCLPLLKAMALAINDNVIRIANIGMSPIVNLPTLPLC